MDVLVTTALACLCVPVYLPLIMRSVRQIQQREVTMTHWSLLNLRVTRLTGNAALVYGIAQLVSSMIIVTGVLFAVAETNILIAFASFVVGWLLGRGGAMLAQSIQPDVTEYAAGFDVIEYPYEHSEDDTDDDAPDIVVLPPPDED